MTSYLPKAEVIKNDPLLAGKMNSLKKVVISHRQPGKSVWNNTIFITENISLQILELKSQPGKDIAIIGSADLSHSLYRSGIIDDSQIIVNPLILGNGKRLFQGIKNRYLLRLTSTRIFNSGNVLLHYIPG